MPLTEAKEIFLIKKAKVTADFSKRNIIREIFVGRGLVPPKHVREAAGLPIFCPVFKKHNGRMLPLPTVIMGEEKQNGGSKWVMSLAENFHFDKSASIAFDRSTANMG